MKKSEARIIMYLHTVKPENKFIRKMCSKLNMDYAYTLEILNLMLEKRWIYKIKNHNKSMLELNGIAPVKQAIEKLKGDDK